jgi:hypothetical protein
MSAYFVNRLFMWPATKRALPCISRLSASSGLAFPGSAAKELPRAVNRRLGNHLCDDDNFEFLLSWIGSLVGRCLLFSSRLNRFPVGIREFGVAEADDHFVQRAGKLERYFVIFAHGDASVFAEVERLVR